MYGSLHAVAYPCACYEEGGEWQEAREGRGDRGRGEEGRGNKRRGRSESDRETERLFNGMELVIGALGRGKGG